jgi:hypothetical protein
VRLRIIDRRSERRLDQEVVHRISRLPARVKPERFLAKVIAFRIQTPLAHVDDNVLHRLGQRILQQLEMHVTGIVDLLVIAKADLTTRRARQSATYNFHLVEHAVHVALQLFVLVDLSIAELDDRLLGDSRLLHAGIVDRLQRLQDLRWRPFIIATRLNVFLTVKQSD